MEGLICQIRMSIVIWLSVLATVMRISADTVASPVEMQGCQNGSCITLKTEVTAEPGLWVVIPCSYKCNDSITDQSVSWYKCEPSKQNCSNLMIQSSNDNDVFRLEPNLSQKNCSITIYNLTEVDFGSFQLRVDGTFNETGVYMWSNVATITVKANSVAEETHTTSTTEQIGQAIITTKYPNTTENKALALTIKILSSTRQSAVLTCMCSDEGLRLLALRQQLLVNDTECPPSTTAPDHPARCPVTLTVMDTSSYNQTNNLMKEQDPMILLLDTIKKPEVVLAFLTGVLLSTIFSTTVCCLMSRSHRKKLKTYGNIAEALEMMTTQNSRLMSYDPEVEDNETNGGGGALAAGKPDVDYSTLKFSPLKRTKKLAEPQETTETEYAEIKKELQSGEERQEVVLIGEANVPEEGKGEDVECCPDLVDVVSEIK